MRCRPMAPRDPLQEQRLLHQPRHHQRAGDTERDPDGARQTTAVAEHHPHHRLPAVGPVPSAGRSRWCGTPPREPSRYRHRDSRGRMQAPQSRPAARAPGCGLLSVCPIRAVNASGFSGDNQIKLCVVPPRTRGATAAGVRLLLDQHVGDPLWPLESRQEISWFGLRAQAARCGYQRPRQPPAPAAAPSRSPACVRPGPRRERASGRTFR